MVIKSGPHSGNNSAILNAYWDVRINYGRVCQKLQNSIHKKSLVFTRKRLKSVDEMCLK